MQLGFRIKTRRKQLNLSLRELAERGFVRSVSLHSTPEEVAAAVATQLEDPLIPPKLDLPTWDDCARDLLLLYRGITGRF